MLAFGLAIFNTLYATQALLPTLTSELGVSPSTAALTVSAATGALALCVVPASILSEKFGRGHVLVISALAATGIGLVLPLAQSAEQLIALRALQGAMIAGTPAVAMTWLSEELDEYDLPGAMGLYIAGNTIGGLTGRLIPAGLLEVTTWRWALLGSGIVAFGLALLAAWLLPEQRNFTPKLSIRPRNEIAAMGRHLHNPRLLALYATAFVAMGVFVSMYNYFGFRAVLDFGLPAALSGLVYVVYLSGTWSSARAGALLKHHGHGVVVLMSSILMLAGALGVASSSLWITLAGLLVFTASFFALHSTASGWVGLIAERDRAEASSMYVFSYYMGSSILGAGTGCAYESLPWVGFIGVLALLLGALTVVATALWKSAQH
ncbi:MFS transporter [Corynebacterium lujinxingii]|uniref:MFS transporter n=2 Tax=Corynebacterium lujinxingii TaxID=2763010 RepID=A0A7H0K297_9CORY|nr:MFS transporter [Corynebacterium lujinxingii]NNO10952.1 MFS transporter [Corynebacterium lujinxingii]QNP91413.1 MFS transporter [Corynebacterium lujinxingii]